MIVKDLLTHTSGLTYGFMRSHAVDALYRARIGLPPKESLEAVIATLGELPLQFSPGRRWQYGMSTSPNSPTRTASPPAHPACSAASSNP
jgi:CubicO group peptidase (beta-lactamase class C family)